MLDMSTKLLTVKEVVELSGISRQMLYRDIKRGRISAIYFGKSVRFKEEEAIKYAEGKKNSFMAKYQTGKREQEGSV